MPEKLPWPRDALMVVACRSGTERLDQMDGTHPGNCRHCGHSITADTFTMRRASSHPLRHGRPIDFFCVECHCLYDLTKFDAFERHNTPEGKAAARAAMEA
jgi:hypothetical protein